MPTVEQKTSSTSPADKDTIEASGVYALPYVLIYVLIPVIFLDYFEATPLTPFFGPFFIFVIIPILDYVIGRDDYNPSKKVRKILENRISFQLVMMIWFPYYTALILWACWYGYPSCVTTAQKASMIINVGLVSGININMAHELIHKHPPLEQWFGILCLCLTSYGHFAVEHLLGHHANVSTIDDPASSRLNESLYAFLPRTIIGSFQSAIHLDAKTTGILWAITLAFAFLCIPSSSIVFFFSQGFIGALLLEIINYIEHYGLSRLPDEPVTPMHSWNAGDRVTNYILVKLQRHSDHHAFAGWRYQTLRSWPHSPQLPYGYATMIIIALCPPLFMKIMNPRVEQVKKYYAKLEQEGKVEEMFTDDYLVSHPEDMTLKHWEKTY